MIYKFGKWLLAFAGWLLSIILTVSLTLAIFGDDNKAVGYLVGIVINIAEVICLMYFIRNYKNPKKHVQAGIAISLTAITALISISASVGSLQISYLKAAMGSDEYKTHNRQLALQDTLTRQLTDVARLQKSRNFLTRSLATLAMAQKQVESMDSTQAKLTTIQKAGAGLGNAMYNAYSQISGVDTYGVALFFNFLISGVIEAIMLFFTAVSGEKEDEKASQVIRTAAGVIVDGVEYVFSDYSGGVSPTLANGGGTYQPATAQITEPEPEQPGFFQKLFGKKVRPEETETASRRDRVGFEIPDIPAMQISDFPPQAQPGNCVNVDRNLSSASVFPLAENVNQDVNQSATESESEILKRLSVKRRNWLIQRASQAGKSDPVILYFWNTEGVRNKALIGRLVGNVLNYTVSRQYVGQVLAKQGRA